MLIMKGCFLERAVTKVEKSPWEKAEVEDRGSLPGGFHLIDRILHT
jgi:hypothetical protein